MAEHGEQALLFNDPQQKTAAIARIAFNVALDGVFDYAVPVELAEHINIGVRVKAPFGRGNRMQTGFCIAVNPPEDKKRRLKTIVEILDDAPLLSKALLELAQWLRGYYRVPLGQVLAAIVPNPVARGAGATYQLTAGLVQSNEQATTRLESERLGPKQKAAIQRLLDGDQVRAASQTALATALGCSVATLKQLMSRKWIEVERTRHHPRLPSSAVQTPAPQLTLTDEQISVLGAVHALVREQRFGVKLIHGVTGSGKTEVYLRTIETVVSAGKQAIVLVPEITLTTQTMERFTRRFERVALLHSALTGAQRNAYWRQIADGEADVVIGPRSAVFAPAHKLGLLIVDEEHEPSYKQETMPRYHGRDVAIKRAHLENIPILLGSATPALESLHNSRTLSHYQYLPMTQRVGSRPMPKVEMVDMRAELRQVGRPGMFSRALNSALGECLDGGQQAILLLNRRGYAGYLMCGRCNYALECSDCSAMLTYHKATQRCICHYCQAQSVAPSRCPVCDAKLLRLSLGTQRLEEELRERFPQARLRRVDSDSMRKGTDYEYVLGAFARGDYNLLLGTQMLAKGLHFPNVTLVGVISADTALSIPDFRASERSFQLIVQVAGRAGRGELPGRVFVQSFDIDAPALQFAARGDYHGFARHELNLRKQLGYPPFGRLVRLLWESADSARLEEHIKQINPKLKLIAEDLDLRGPVPAPIFKIEGTYRWHLLVRSTNAAAIQQFLDRAISANLGATNIRLSIDVDPATMV